MLSTIYLKLQFDEIFTILQQIFEISYKIGEKENFKKFLSKFSQESLQLFQKFSASRPKCSDPWIEITSVGWDPP